MIKPPGWKPPADVRRENAIARSVQGNMCEDLLSQTLADELPDFEYSEWPALPEMVYKKKCDKWVPVFRRRGKFARDPSLTQKK